MLVIVALSFAGEKVALNDGIGWDGEIYYNTMRRFITLIKHHGFNQYDIQRIMPWGLTQIICALLNVEVTRNIAIASGILYNSIALILSVLFYFRISNLKNWKLSTEIVGFSFLFFVYPVLKQVGYYPVTSDMIGYALGLMMCYYFLVDKKWALILLGIVGLFMWPTTTICAFALAFFSRKELQIANNYSNKDNKRFLQVIYFILAVIPFSILIFSMLQQGGDVMAAMKVSCSLMLPKSIWIVPITCLCSCLYYCYMVSAFKVDLLCTLRENFSEKRDWVNLGLFILSIGATAIVSRSLANGNPGSLTTMQALQRVELSSMAEPFVFIENHFIYYGLGFLLVILLWRRVANVVTQQGLGFLFVVALWVLFSIGPEARVSIMYWVFPLMALLMYLDTINIRSFAFCVLIIVQLILSRFWYTINVSDMEKYLSWDNYENYQEYPAQRYFMSQGPWQSYQMYYIFMALTIISGIILYIGIKKNWFVYNQERSAL